MWNQLRTSVHLWSCPGTNIQPMKIRFSFRTKVRHMSVIDHCQNQETGLELKRCLGQWHVTTYSFGSSKHTLPLGLRHQETHLMFYGFSTVLSFIDSLWSYTLRATGNGQWLHGETLTFFVPYNIIDLCLGTLYNGSRMWGLPYIWKLKLQFTYWWPLLQWQMASFHQENTYLALPTTILFLNGDVYSL